MATELDPVKRGLLAQQALNNEVLQDAFEVQRAAYVAAIQRCAVGDDLGRYRLAEALKLVDAIRGHLSTVAQTGKLADDRLRELQQQRELRQRKPPRTF